MNDSPRVNWLSIQKGFKKNRLNRKACCEPSSARASRLPWFQSRLSQSFQNYEFRTHNRDVFAQARVVSHIIKAVLPKARAVSLKTAQNFKFWRVAEESSPLRPETSPQMQSHLANIKSRLQKSGRICNGQFFEL